jgi:hypothetical protein
MDKENTNPNTEKSYCVEFNVTLKKENEKYKHDFNFHQKYFTSEVNGSEY